MPDQDFDGEEPQTDAQANAAAAQFGRYTILQKLGSGGMAEVFLARLNGIGGFDKTVVIKRTLPDLLEDPAFIRMFLDEARVIANLNHPNVIQTFEIGQAEGRPYIAMEYARGPTLSEVMREAFKKGREHFGHFAKIMSDVCAGLHHAHMATDAAGRPLGIVHRDVSPMNVIVSLDGVPKVLDFGVAKSRGRLTNTAAGTVKGRFRYMAPEQLRGEEVDRRADVFAVGVCLYQAMTGRLPFAGNNEFDVMRSVLKGEFDKPSVVVPEIPKVLEDTILWAMAANVEDRAPDCLAVHNALEAFLQERPWNSSTTLVRSWLNGLFPNFKEKSYTAQGGIATPGGRPVNLGLEITRGTPHSGPKTIPVQDADIVDDKARAVPLNRSNLPAALIGAGVVLVLALGGTVAYLALRSPAPAFVPAAPVAKPAPTPSSPDDAVGRAKRASGLAALEAADYDRAIIEFTAAKGLLSDSSNVDELLRVAEDLRARAQTPTRPSSAFAQPPGTPPALLPPRPAAHLPDRRLSGREKNRNKLSGSKVAALVPAEDPDPVAPPVAGPSTGLLLVTSSPKGLLVHVDGAAVDMTPSRQTLKLGRHTVALYDGERKLTEQSVDVTADTAATVFKDVSAMVATPARAAEPAPPQPTAPAATTPAPASTSPAASAAAAAAPPPNNLGGLSVTAPGLYGEVWINNRPYGFAPISAQNLRAGPVTVQIRVQGQVKRTANVTVEPGKVIDVRVR